MELNLITSKWESRKNHPFWVVNGETKTECFMRFYSTRKLAMADAMDTAVNWRIGATVRVLRKEHGRDYQTIFKTVVDWKY